MKYSYQRSNKRILTIFILGIVIGSLATYYYFINFVIINQEKQSQIETSYVLKEPIYSHVKLSLVAVDQNGNGVSTPLIVEAKPGNGKALTNVDKLLFWVDTQYSIQVAKAVAENVTKINASNYDLIYSIETNATVIGGPSAGAALTIATIAALKNEKIRDDVVITGTIEEDGTIGEVGGILEKAKAAKEIGANLFLVPKGQGEQTFLKPEESCIRKANFIFCETVYKQVTVNIGKDVGIAVIEVSNVEEAYKYFKL
ncbi:MAG: S16 family serine protease [Candidatus Aenigmatarchaeota archaeon]